LPLKAALKNGLPAMRVFIVRLKNLRAWIRQGPVQEEVREIA